MVAYQRRTAAGVMSRRSVSAKVARMWLSSSLR
ncbi:Uncharacterised protein [Mycobacterium tuberculosis]|nr:Uncharacterised protein [Mycobacterium tuberculosis]